MAGALAEGIVDLDWSTDDARRTMTEVEKVRGLWGELFYGAACLLSDAGFHILTSGH